MTQITLSDLPEIIQTLLNQAQKTGEPLTITQNGIPFAIISPIKKKSLLETLSTLEPLDEDFADVDEGLLPLDDIEFSK
ncbi:MULTISPECIES: type II toxin-antitoxin system prevent-host-death family antitoxin [unclassified Nostoc]|uniref:type II toxin-antitoxin system Phd/YefM family antitoxin n=1 Tax=unclassified Nostoc TaxID=2593658 RepID=UPI0025AB1640|nr:MULTISPECIES: type II toxin-antitoxin system prevent-host-death family antitoxin [unclassified Nostoc]MDM9580657.1 type II toxin-antitoxin system prevent-host-death family antitoxin [Nostoc sp. GT001]MDZ7945842.1 type II toxin-antitoxin system prevent-host-death family antitoxin [Nostoc sp. EfeVER01]MDZ7990607.1 type II toxin-antitoxin system prevent-host-death family antitoxin [Nostoc sp. EspVER01]